MCASRFRSLMALASILTLVLIFVACQPGAVPPAAPEPEGETGAPAEAPAEAPAGDNMIRIGMTAPLTGPASEAGVALRQGAELAVEEINADGGVDLDGTPYTLELLVEDEQSKPEAGVAAGEKLITKDNVDYLIGDAFHSSVTMAVMELAPKYEIPVVSAEPVSEAIADKVAEDPDRYRYYWKGDFGATAYASTVFNTVQWLVDSGQLEPDTKSVFYIVEDTDYGRSNAEEAARLFEEIGWSTVSIETVELGHTEFYPQLNKLREANPDVLMSVFTPLSSGVALVKQFQELGVDALHMAIYYPTRPEFIEQAGDASEGLLWTPLIFDPAHIDAHKEFAAKIQDKYGVEPTSDHGYGYDAVYNAADSFSRAGSTDPDAVVEAVANLDRQGIMGRYVFDQTNHQIKAGPDFIPVPTAQIQDGQNLIVWPEQLAAADYQPQPWIQ
jgi:branched-chain amino acid transport system substrate-binding protein